MPDKEMIQISYDELTKLLNYRREYFVICDEFKIPAQKRGEAWVAKGIIERIHTYLTGYVGRRSLAERENGSGLRPIDTQKQITEHIVDPVLDKPIDS